MMSRIIFEHFTKTIKKYWMISMNCNILLKLKLNIAINPLWYLEVIHLSDNQLYHFFMFSYFIYNLIICANKGIHCANANHNETRWCLVLVRFLFNSCHLLTLVSLFLIMPLNRVSFPMIYWECWTYFISKIWLKN